MQEADIDALLAGAKIKDYPKGARLFLQGDGADRFFVIINGWIKLYRGTPDGDEAVVALFTRGDVFGEAAIFDNTNYPFAAEAVEQATLIEIPSALLKNRAKANPDITARLMDSMSREMHKLQMENEHIILMSASQRVGCLLLQLSSGMLGTGGAFSFPYDKALAAQRLGMKPETFSRALAQLKPAGVTVKGSEIRIESFSGLVDYACGHCTSLSNECRGSRTKECKENACPKHKKSQCDD